jgi:hypothetical protein
LLHPGVKAPGTPKMTTFLPEQTSSRFTLLSAKKKKANESARHPKNDDLLTRTDLL